MSQNVNQLRGICKSCADIVGRIVIHIWATGHAKSIILVCWNYEDDLIIQIRKEMQHSCQPKYRYPSECMESSRPNLVMLEPQSSAAFHPNCQWIPTDHEYKLCE